MGLYIYITDQDRVNWRKVDDAELKELFDEALQHDETLMISENSFLERDGFFKKLKKVTTYTIYHECFMNEKPTFEARQQISASGSKQIVSAYLYGIINGSLSKTRSLAENNPQCKVNIADNEKLLLSDDRDMFCFNCMKWIGDKDKCSECENTELGWDNTY